MQMPTSCTHTTLAGKFLEKGDRFRVVIRNQDIVEDPPGVECSSGFIVDEKWPSAGNLGQEQIPLRLRVNVNQLHDPLFISRLLVAMYEQARRKRGMVDVDTRSSN